jgi:hypothetical protein
VLQGNTAIVRVKQNATIREGVVRLLLRIIATLEADDMEKIAMQNTVSLYTCVNRESIILRGHIFMCFIGPSTLSETNANAAVQEEEHVQGSILS